MASPYVNICSPCAPKDCETDIYCGPPLPGSGIETGDSMVVAIQKLDNVLFTHFGAYTTTTTTTVAPTTTTTTTETPTTTTTTTI